MMLGLPESAWISMFVGVALKSTAIFAAAGLMTLLFYRRSAAARHLVWFAAAAALLLLPFLSVSMPPLNVPVSRIPAFLDAGATDHSTATGFPEAPAPATIGTGEPNAHITRLTKWVPDWQQWLIFVWVFGIIVGCAQHRGARSLTSWRMGPTAGYGRTRRDIVFQ